MINSQRKKRRWKILWKIWKKKYTFKAQKKRSEITDDDMKDIEKDMQDLTDKMCKEIDVLLEKKQKELMSV